MLPDSNRTQSGLKANCVGKTAAVIKLNSFYYTHTLLCGCILAVMLLASEYEQYMLVNLGYIVNRFSQWPYVYIG